MTVGFPITMSCMVSTLDLERKWSRLNLTKDNHFILYVIVKHIQTDSNIHIGVKPACDANLAAHVLWCSLLVD